MCAFYFFWLSASHGLRLGMDGMPLALCDHGFERSGLCAVNNNNILVLPHLPTLLTVVCINNSLYGQHFQLRMDQPGMVANPARGQLNRENELLLVLVRA